MHDIDLLHILLLSRLEIYKWNITRLTIDLKEILNLNHSKYIIFLIMLNHAALIKIAN